jgi:hypothetical protein
VTLGRVDDFSRARSGKTGSAATSFGPLNRIDADRIIALMEPTTARVE